MWQIHAQVRSNITMGEYRHDFICRIGRLTPAVPFNFQFGFLGSWWSNSSVRLHCDKDTLNDIDGVKAIILLNHHCEIDYLFIGIWAEAAGVLGMREI